jgi:hypothetical protein
MEQLRAVLRDRALRRATHAYGKERREAEALAGSIARGVAATVSFPVLKGALWEAGLATADELHAMGNSGIRSFVVEPDGALRAALP